MAKRKKPSKKESRQIEGFDYVKNRDGSEDWQANFNVQMDKQEAHEYLLELMDSFQDLKLPKGVDDAWMTVTVEFWREGVQDSPSKQVDHRERDVKGGREFYRLARVSDAYEAFSSAAARIESLFDDDEVQSINIHVWKEGSK